MKRRLLLTIPLFIFICSPFYAHAQTYDSDGVAIENTIGIGPRLGYYKAEDAEEGNFYGGVQLRARLGPVFGLEAAVEYHTRQAFGVGDFTVDTRLIPITGSALLFIPLSEHFVPYGIAGIGAYYTIYDYPDDALDLELEDFDSFNLGYHLGFGLELPINSNVALNVDYRYLFLNPDENEENLDDASFNGNVFTAGLMFYL